MSSNRDIEYSHKILHKIEEKDGSDLVKYIKKQTEKRELLKVKFDFDRSIFHVLVLKNKWQTLSYLLNFLVKECGKNSLHYASRPDQFGKTILHYSINHQSDVEILKLILEHVPELLNRQDAKGDTPLHYAVKCGNVKAINFLVSLPHINRSILNAKEQTVFDVADESHALDSVILSPRLESIGRLDPRKRKLHFDNYLANNFTQLTKKMEVAQKDQHLICRTSFESGRFYNYLLNISSSSDHSLMSDKAEEGLLDLLNGEREYDEVNYIDAFSHLFSRPIKKDDILIAKLSPAIISRILKDSYPFVNELYVSFQNSNCKKIKIISELMFMQKELALNNKPLSDFSGIEKFSSDKEMLKEIWLLVSCQDELQSERIFDPEKIKSGVLYLISEYSILSVMTTLKLIYPVLDNHQKMIANMIFLFAVVFYSMHFDRPDASFYAQIKFYSRWVGHNSHEITQVTNSFQKLLADFEEESRDFFSNPLVHNFMLFSTLAGESSILNNRESFESVVDKALLKKKGERRELLSVISSELRLITIRFYANVLLEEWGKKGLAIKNVVNEESHPAITQFTHDFNKFSNFFIWKMLNQPRSNLKNFAEFMVELASYTCNLHEDESFPDLTSAMLISTVINKADVDRLGIFTALADEDKKVIDEINHLTDVKSNNIVMRSVVSRCSTALPFPASYLKDIQFATDGNKSNINRAVSVGSILASILSAKLLFSFSCAFHLTNLPVFLKSYVMKDENQIGYASLKIKPAIDLPSVFLGDEMLAPLFKKINQYTVELKLPPPLIYKFEVASPSKSIEFMIRFFFDGMVLLDDQLKKKPMEYEGALILSSNCNLFQIALENMIHVINNQLVAGEEHELEIGRINSQLDDIETMLSTLQKMANAEIDKGSRDLKRSKSLVGKKHSLFKEASHVPIIHKGRDEHLTRPNIIK